MTGAGVGSVQSSWQPRCPVLPWDVFVELRERRAGSPSQRSSNSDDFCSVLPGWDGGAGEAPHNVLNALRKSNNCLDCPLFRGRQERESFAELQIASSERECPGRAARGIPAAWKPSGSISACPGYIHQPFSGFEGREPFDVCLSEGSPAAGAAVRGAAPNRTRRIRGALGHSYRSTPEPQPGQKLGLSSSPA